MALSYNDQRWSWSQNSNKFADGGFKGFEFEDDVGGTGKLRVNLHKLGMLVASVIIDYYSTAYLL